MLSRLWRKEGAMGRVEGKVALITGGASGLGLATAELMLAEGATVVITDLQAEQGEAAAARLAAGGGRIEFRQHDVTDEAQWEGTVAAVLARHGRLDILVNAAGIASKGERLIHTTLEEWRRVNAVNVEGTFLGLKHAIPAMAAQGGGAIVNISSILGLVGSAMSGPYSASKGAVRLLTKSAALECKRFKEPVRVNSVHPGYIDTPMLRARLQQPDGERLRAYVEGMQGALGEPRDIAEGILYLASDAARLVNGAELVIDGGFTAQ
jgi:NAD(P)-dependent dehydrogenase (short-subunit alcohol dehydrogenase family)